MTARPGFSLARRASAGLLAVLLIAGLAAGWIAPYPLERQFRDSVNAPPSARFWLGTDDLGRDRFSRLLHATRISALLAPAASALAVLCAAAAGAAAAFRPGMSARLVMGAADLALSIPWLLLLLTVRAALPLDVEAWISLVVTFALLGVLGWAGPARVIRSRIVEVLRSDFVLSARARGAPPFKILVRHVLPNTRPVLAAQFWSAIPMFIMAEANLSLLGLGVAEPAASWGTMLRELETVAGGGLPLLENYWVLAPVALVLASVLCLTALFPSRVTT